MKKNLHEFIFITAQYKKVKECVS